MYVLNWDKFRSTKFLFIIRITLFDFLCIFPRKYKLFASFFIRVGTGSDVAEAVAVSISFQFVTLSFHFSSNSISFEFGFNLVWLFWLPAQGRADSWLEWRIFCFYFYFLLLLSSVNLNYHTDFKKILTMNVYL